jgi:hypothetical protein
MASWTEPSRFVEEEAEAPAVAVARAGRLMGSGLVGSGLSGACRGGGKCEINQQG